MSWNSIPGGIYRSNDLSKINPISVLHIKEMREKEEK